MTTAKTPSPLTFPERIDPAHTALIVVDVQNDFVLPDGVCGRAGNDLSAIPAMMDKLKILIDQARKAGVFIVHVQTIYDEPVLSRALTEQYGRQSFQNLCITGTRGAALAEGFGPIGLPNEVVVTKNRYSAFWGSDIDLVLRSNGIETLVMTGVATEVCVESTARDAFFRDYFIIEADECVGSYSPARDAASKVVLARSFAKIFPVAEIGAVWEKAAPGPRNWHQEVRRAKLMTTLRERLEPSRTALVLIDLQNDFCDEQGACAAGAGGGLSMIAETLPRIRRLLGAARQAGATIIHVKAEYGPHVRNVGSPRRIPDTRSTDGAVWTVSAGEGPIPAEDAEVCLPGTWGAAFVEGFGPIGQEQVVVKHRYSGFVDTRLDLLLRAKEITTVVMAGVATNCCVESTARDAAMRDYYLVVGEDCVAVRDRHRSLHAASLETLRTYFGRVEPLERILAAWRAYEPQARAAN